MLGLPDGAFLFTPKLSPIIGSWLLLCSAVTMLFSGTSLVHTFSYGTLTSKLSMHGYDAVSLWFLRITSVSGSNHLLPYVYLVIVVLAVLMLTSFISILGLLKRG